MDILSLLPYVYTKFILFILAFVRISSLFSTFVFFRREIVNRRILISLSSALAFYVIMQHSEASIYNDVFSIRMTIGLFFQFFIGFIAGLILNIVFEIFVALGQIFSTQIGFTLASMIDPSLGSITNLTQFYMYSIAIIFLSLNGHLFMIKIIMDSFTFFSLNLSSMPDNLISEVIKYSSVIFSASVMLSITAIIAILLTNLSLAVMTRFAPQFNIFSIGINMTMILGMICVYLTYSLFISKGSDLILEALIFMQNLFAGLR